MAMPARHRDRLQAQCAGQLVATIDTQSKCLLVYPLPTWEDLEREIQALPTLNPVVRRFQRLVIGYASDLECDASGRVLLPPALRDYAGLDKKALWDEETWLAERDKWLQMASVEGAVPDEMLRLSL